MKLGYDDLKKNFDIYDKDRSGNITVFELKRYYQERGMTMDENSLNYLMKKYDTNSNGLIDFNEFCRFINGNYSSYKQYSPPKPPTSHHRPPSYERNPYKPLNTAASPVVIRGSPTTYNTQQYFPPRAPSPTIPQHYLPQRPPSPSPPQQYFPQRAPSPTPVQPQQPRGNIIAILGHKAAPSPGRQIPQSTVVRDIIYDQQGLNTPTNKNERILPDATNVVFTSMHK